jgi:hypothetical protein
LQSIIRSIVFASLGFLTASSAHAFISNAKMPVCLDGPTEMQVDNSRILALKHSTKNQYLDRAFVQGTIISAPTVQNGHDHFAIKIGPGAQDNIEIIYNIEFGAMPSMTIGQTITVCGDYITSNAAAGGYQASPDGAIIHWIHFNPGSRSGSANHAHGFVMNGSNLIGFDGAPTGDWNGQVVKTTEPTGGTPSVSPAAQDNSQSQPPRSRPSNPGNGRPSVGRWHPCRSIQECSARNQ